MLKHMLTTACPRSCEYCITRNIKADESRDWDAINKLYIDFKAQGHTEIMLTGGEPTSANDFYHRAYLAGNHFNVHMTTQNPEMISREMNDWVFDSIVYSLHDGLKDEKVGLKKCRVYGAILDEQYVPELPVRLKEQGFSGLTINEEQREGVTFDEELPEIEGFTIRINRAGHCMDETIILPNLTVITDYTPYL